MLSLHIGRRSLGATIATVLAVTAVTAGAGALAVAPASATEHATAAAGPSSLLPMVPEATLASAGAKGFLTYVPHDTDAGKYRWTPYAGGAARDMTYDNVDGYAETSGDTVVTSIDGFGAKALDMSTGAWFFKRDVDDGMDSFYAGVAGQALFARGNTKLWEQNGDTEPRPVTGLPDGLDYGQVRPGDATHGLLGTQTAAGVKRTGLIDLTDATISFPYPQQARNPVVSGNRVAWVEDDTATHTLRVVVRDLTTGTDTVVPVPGTTAGASLEIHLLGGWVTYGTTALSIATGETVGLFDRADASFAIPDGSALIVQGSGTAQGDGVYRVSLGTDGRPAVGLLAHAGTSTSAMHDIDSDGLSDLLGRDAAGVLWQDSADDGNPRARIGGGWQIYDKIETVGDITSVNSAASTADVVARDKAGVLWLYSGLEDGGFAPRVRIGGGWQVYTHLSGGSDLTGDGRADVTAIDRSGVRWLYRGTGETSRPFEPRERVGTGWAVYGQIAAVGNLAGSAAGDLVARDKDGVLWLYLGKGDGTFSRRTRIGGGWQVYSQLVGAGDVDHDGKADLFTYNSATHTVYLYSGTGDPARPFEPKAISDAHTGNTYDYMS